MRKEEVQCTWLVGSLSCCLNDSDNIPPHMTMEMGASRHLTLKGWAGTERILCMATSVETIDTSFLERL